MRYIVKNQDYAATFFNSESVYDVMFQVYSHLGERV